MTASAKNYVFLSYLKLFFENKTSLSTMKQKPHRFLFSRQEWRKWGIPQLSPP